MDKHASMNAEQTESNEIYDSWSVKEIKVPARLDGIDTTIDLVPRMNQNANKEKIWVFPDISDKSPESRAKITAHLRKECGEKMIVSNSLAQSGTNYRLNYLCPGKKQRREEKCLFKLQLVFDTSHSRWHFSAGTGNATHTHHAQPKTTSVYDNPPVQEAKTVTQEKEQSSGGEGDQPQATPVAVGNQKTSMYKKSPVEEATTVTPENEPPSGESQGVAIVSTGVGNMSLQPPVQEAVASRSAPLDEPDTFSLDSSMFSDSKMVDTDEFLKAFILQSEETSQERKRAGVVKPCMSANATVTSNAPSLPSRSQFVPPKRSKTDCSASPSEKVNMLATDMKQAVADSADGESLTISATGAESIEGFMSGLSLGSSTGPPRSNALQGNSTIFSPQNGETQRLSDKGKADAVLRQELGLA